MLTVSNLNQAELIGGIARSANPDGSWVVYEAGDVLPPSLFGAPSSSSVPTEVSMRQARLALNAAGQLSAVESAINALPEPQKTAARIEWDYATTVARDWPLVQMLAPVIGLDLDALFSSAAEL